MNNQKHSSECDTDSIKAPDDDEYIINNTPEPPKDPYNENTKYLIEAKNNGLFHFNKYGDYVIDGADAFKIFKELWKMKKNELEQEEKQKKTAEIGKISNRNLKRKRN